MSAPSLTPNVSQLAVRCGRSWPTTERAASDASDVRSGLATQLSAAGLIPADTSAVVFGSLLLESKSLTDDDIVRKRVLRALLARYVGEDLLYHEPERFLVPRFLLNDYVRYWRTMAVDSAQKRRDRVAKWALRNIKLRLSRKLIFASGLLACLNCRLHPSAELKKARDENDREGVRTDMTAFLLEYSQRPPLETLASAFLTYEAWDAAAKSFDAYEAFLRLLDNPEHREHLEKLQVEDAVSDNIFVQAKKAAADFQEGLTALFFGTHPDLTSAAQTDGIF